MNIESHILVDTVIGEVQKAQSQAQKGDKDGAEQTLTNIDTSAIDKRATDYGFKDCGNSGD